VVVRYTQFGPQAGTVELINGGHVSPLIVHADGSIETVTDHDVPVGLLDFATFHSIKLSLDTGDRIVLLSDGISEAEDVGGVQFGLRRWATNLTKPDTVAKLFAALETFCEGTHAQDDQTILTIDRTA